jgi:hypothetical protein
LIRESRIFLYKLTAFHTFPHFLVELCAAELAHYGWQRPWVALENIWRETRCAAGPSLQTHGFERSREILVTRRLPEYHVLYHVPHQKRQCVRAARAEWRVSCGKRSFIRSRKACVATMPPDGIAARDYENVQCSTLNSRSRLRMLVLKGDALPVRASLQQPGDNTLITAGDDGRSYLIERVFVVSLAKSAYNAALHLCPWINKHTPANQSN